MAFSFLYMEPIFNIRSPEDFRRHAWNTFIRQFAHNGIYRQFVQLVRPQGVHTFSDIPFLPIAFFKSHPVKAFSEEPVLVFTSSSTTGSVPSRHEILSPERYRQSMHGSFEKHFGPAAQACHLALLPAYLERSGSSLIWMVHDFIARSDYPQSGFYLQADEELRSVLQNNAQNNVPTFLWGVTFALLDFAEKSPMKLPGIHIIETGGMKGRRKEIIREELHEILHAAFSGCFIHSEYGMTELLSQAYAVNGSRFVPPPWMQVEIVDPYDPQTQIPDEKTGMVRIIDLANQDSCSFICTEDLGLRHSDGSFEIKGRFDSSDIRGCNLMVS